MNVVVIGVTVVLGLAAVYGEELLKRSQNLRRKLRDDIRRRVGDQQWKKLKAVFDDL
jgi:hypothetical protein